MLHSVRQMWLMEKRDSYWHRCYPKLYLQSLWHWKDRQQCYQQENLLHQYGLFAWHIHSRVEYFSWAELKLLPARVNQRLQLLLPVKSSFLSPEAQSLHQKSSGQLDFAESSHTAYP